MVSWSQRTPWVAQLAGVCSRCLPVPFLALAEMRLLLEIFLLSG
jgi:hypothetical protein